MIRTLAPLAAAVSAMWEPMNPAPPVTTTTPDNDISLISWSLLPTHTYIFKTYFAHVFGITNVSQVGDSRSRHQLVNATHIQGSELVPFSHKNQGLRAFHCIVLVVSIRNFGKYFLRFRFCYGVVGLNQGTIGEKTADNPNRWSFTHIVGLRFECESKNRDLFIF